MQKEEAGMGRLGFCAMGDRRRGKGRVGGPLGLRAAWLICCSHLPRLLGLRTWNNFHHVAKSKMDRWSPNLSTSLTLVHLL